MLSIPVTPARRRRFGPIVLAGIGWVCLNLAVVLLAHGFLPFDRPNLARMPFAWQLAMPSLGLVEQLALMGMVAVLTRHRDLSARFALVPERAAARRETIGLLAYAMAAQAAGWVIAPWFGARPFSFHLAGTLFGCAVPPSPAEALLWAGYNFAAYVLVPLLWFGRRYDRAALWLMFDARRRDLLVLVAVLVVESAVQLAVAPGVLGTPLAVWIKAGPLALALFMVGTVLPTMVLIYAILVPRYWRLTGSIAASTILGGLTYAAMHLVEGWSRFSSPRDTALSLLFVFVTYTGPGMYKSFVTLRTGNAWVHALGYHAVAPHTLFDTPLVARIFAIR
jgi:hypothetical protein